eukprot:6198924-Pleurochrysis_carterae.AAC.1
MGCVRLQAMMAELAPEEKSGLVDFSLGSLGKCVEASRIARPRPLPLDLPRPALKRLRVDQQGRLVGLRAWPSPQRR